MFGDGTADGPNNTTPLIVPEEPLAVRVLGLIQGKPGSNRRVLYEGFGNRVKAHALDEALAWLAANGLAHPRSVSTGGRPAECWWPGPGESGPCERIIPPPDHDPDPQPEIVRSLAAPEPTEPPVMTDGEFLDGLGAEPLPLADLIAWVNALGGKFVHRDGVVGVEAPGSLPEAVLTAVAAHQAELRAVVPESPVAERAVREPSPEWRASYEKSQAEYQAELRQRRGDDDPPMIEAEFLGALRGIGPPTAG